MSLENEGLILVHFSYFYSEIDPEPGKFFLKVYLLVQLHSGKFFFYFNSIFIYSSHRLRIIDKKQGVYSWNLSINEAELWGEGYYKNFKVQGLYHFLIFYDSTFPTTILSLLHFDSSCPWHYYNKKMVLSDWRTCHLSRTCSRLRCPKILNFDHLNRDFGNST